MYNYINFTTFGCMTAPSGWYIPKTYIVNRLYYIHSGKAFLNGEKESLLQNYIYVFPCTMKFEIVQDDFDPCNHLFFDFIMIPSLSGVIPLIYEVKERSELYYLLMAVSELFQNIGSEKERCIFRKQAENYFCRIWEIINNEKPVETVINPVVNEAVLYMNKNYMNHITIADIAYAMNRNINYFIKIFKKCTGMTPYEYLTELRMDKATIMIYSGESISSVADAVGFDSVSAFSVSYKKHRGLSPEKLIRRV